MEIDVNTLLLVVLLALVAYEAFKPPPRPSTLQQIAGAAGPIASLVALF